MSQKFSFEKLNLEGAFLINPFEADDERGYFLKDYSKEIFEKNNIKHDLQEVFYTYSKPGVIRAIHFQKIMQQPKLVRCVSGEVFDVIVDLRKKSDTFGKWQGVWLSGINKKEVFVPAGFGHGYLVIKESIVSYKCAQKFYGEYDDGIIWNDPELGIEWPIEKVETIILSEKDKKLQSFKDFKEQNEGGFVV